MAAEVKEIDMESEIMRRSKQVILEFRQIGQFWHENNIFCLIYCILHFQNKQTNTKQIKIDMESDK